jgi:hypothetical protein
MKITLALALSALSAVAHAEAVTYNFSGTFDTARNAEAFAGLIKQGDHFSGQFTFDTAATPVFEFSGRGPNYSFYETLGFKFKASDAFNNAVPAWTAPTEVFYTQVNGPNIEIGSYFMVGGPPWEPSPVTNLFSVDAAANSGGGRYNWLLGVTAESSHTSFDDNRIPVGFNDIVNPSFSIQVYDNQTKQWGTFDGAVQIQYAGVSPVPEPSSALMLLAGLAGVGGAAALRRRRA